MSIPLELLAPAGSVQIGMAAIDHGADAVYIGAPLFSARAQANQTLDEIAELINYAHFFHSRVYVALNTLLKDEEIPQALDIITSLDAIGADGLIIQDFGLLELDLPPLPLIASTQMHNTAPQKVKFLEAVGFQKVVLARELSLKEIAAIRAQTSVELEVFVHGALCVSYSGQCYMSHYSCGRSANRGVCSQPCRHAYTLMDGDGKTILSDKHLLSQKDLNRLAALPDLVGAGVTSFKIEGRYKDSDYVKNITAAYRIALDQYIADHPAYHRAGSGSCSFAFQPDPAKTFNRGETTYFLRHKRQKTASLQTPKSMGQFIGKVNKIGRDFFKIHPHDLHNGDGLCFLDSHGNLAGCRVDRSNNDRIFPNTMQKITIGAAIYRNFDAAFSRILKRSSRCRTLAVKMEFWQEPSKIGLTITDEDGVTVDHWQDLLYVEARNPKQAKHAVERQLASTGGTPYKIESLIIHPKTPGFVPLGVLNDLRRQALDKVTQARKEQYIRKSVKISPNSFPFPDPVADYHANVANTLAEKFYARHGMQIRETALELVSSAALHSFDRPVMTTRYCLRYQMDACLRLKPGKEKMILKPPLRIFDKTCTYLLEFQCRECRMLVIPDKPSDRFKPKKFSKRKK